MKFSKNKPTVIEEVGKRFKLLAMLSVVLTGSLIAPMATVFAAPQPVGSPSPNTSTQPASKFSTYSIEQQAQTWTAIKAAVSIKCNFTGENTQQITSGEWFSGSKDVIIGYHVEPDKGKVQCDNQNKWFSTLLDEAGFANDYITPATAVFGTSKFDGNLNVDQDKAHDNLKKIFQDAFFNGDPIPTLAPDYLAYQIYLSNFTANKSCNAQEAPPTSDVNARAMLTQNGKVITTIKVYDEATKSVVAKEFVYENPTKDIGIGYGMPNAFIECKTIASKLANPNYAQGYSDYRLAYPDTPPTGSTTDAANASGDKASCENNSGALGWIICSVIDAMSGAVDGIYSHLIQPLLDTAPLDLNTGMENKNFQVWSTFRIIGDIFLVIALLVIVFGQSIGGGLIDAYSAKKILPRLFAAAILINLSYYLVALAVDVTNVIGGGIQSLVLAPFLSQGEGIKVGIGGGATSTAVTGIGMGAAIAGLWSGAAAGTLGASATAAGVFLAGPFLDFFLLFILLPAILTVLGILALLIFRQGLIILLVFTAPVAFALYCLPNTEQYFRKWWDLLLKTLLIYPIIALLFAMANVFSITITQANGPGGILKEIMAIVTLFVPLFLIPFAFRLAGGVLGKVHDVMSTGGKRFNETVKGNPNDQDSLRNRTKRNLGGAATKTQMGIVSGGRKVGASRRSRLASAVLSRGNNVDSRFAKYNELAAKRREQVTSFGNDELVYAGAGYKVKNGEERWDGSVNRTGDTEYFASRGNDPISKEAYTQGKRQYGATQHEVTQGLGYTTSKMLTDDHAKQMSFAFNRNAEQSNWTPGDIDGNWLGATYPHKGQFASVRYSAPILDEKTGKVSSAVLSQNDGAYYNMMKDLHKTRQSFRLNEMRDQDWGVMQTRQQNLEGSLMANDYSLGNSRVSSLHDEQQKAVASGKLDPSKAKSVTEIGQNLRSEDARNLAMTYEIFDGATQQMRGAQATNTPGAPGADPSEVSAAGATPAAQSIIENSVASRKLKLVDTNRVDNRKSLIHQTSTGAGGATVSNIVADNIYTTGDSIK